MEREPRGVLAAFDELLKNPSAGVQRIISGGTLRPALAVLAGALACYVLYGAASGFFQGGGQVLLAAMKAPLVVMFSVALCLPSLYILSALMGAEITARRLLVIVASFAGTLGIFMAGLLPITWLFSVSSRSLPFMVWMHLLLWGVTVILAGRCLQLLLRLIGARSFVAPWVILFIVVSFQSATLFRPLIWQRADAARFPGLTEKMSFFEHFVGSMGTPAEALEPDDGAANLDAVMGVEHARTRTPRLGDISQAGDLAWMTGPITVTAANAPPQPGVYLTIWTRQADGSWRVVKDLATPTPEPVTFAGDGFVRLPRESGRYTRRSVGDGGEALLDLDSSFGEQTKTVTPQNVFGQFLDSETRLYRPSRAPLVGQRAIHEYLSTQPVMVFRPTDGGIAASHDLGYTFGRYVTKPVDFGPPVESGSYLRVWSRWASGVWTIVADVTTPDPPR